MLLSYVNTQLRDYYKSLDELCESKELDKNRLLEQMESIDYYYNEETNQFV